MKKIYTFFIAIFLLQACASEQESAAIDNILMFYGGRAEWSIGRNASTDDEEIQGKFFEIKLSDADLSSYKYLSMPASNIAYLFYSSLAPDEKNSYDFVRVIVDYNGKEKVVEYPTQELELVSSSMPVFESTAEILKTEKYERLEELLEKNYRAEIGGYENTFAQVDSAYGKVTGLSIHGYSFSQGKVGSRYTDLLKLSGVLTREKQHTDFSVTVDAKDPQKKIVDVKFQK
ncbi:hypothetical protein ACMA1I_16895 [Pontibacter sp. 13R65]|uniref:hypothetical protein n=1 Tax=Pontibacter sp. 13R65 TaxID=3127458 RepID=UPI00301DE2ED